MEIAEAASSPMNPLLKNSLKKIRLFAYTCVNFFLYPVLARRFTSWILKVPHETSLFLVGRLDLGTFILHLHYAAYWNLHRNRTVLCVLSAKFQMIADLAAVLCPQIPIYKPPFSVFFKALSKIFGEVNVQECTFARLYVKLASLRKDSLYIYDQHCSPVRLPLRSYHKEFDPKFRSISNSGDFLKSYLFLQSYTDRNEETFSDYRTLSQNPIRFKDTLSSLLDNLQKTHRLDGPYAILNLNCKLYRYSSEQVRKIANARRIAYPERYDPLIDYLIERGFQVVLQGRSEQPFFSPRKGLHDLSKQWGSVVLDAALYKGAAFCIACKTGPETFAHLFDVPVLGLNYTELASLIPFNKLRFVPKHILDDGRPLSWKSWLFHPIYFNREGLRFEYEELSSEELIEAAKEFLPLLIRGETGWTDYSSLQQEFRSRVTPFHIDLHETKGAVCDSYLKLPYHESQSDELIRYPAHV